MKHLTIPLLAALVIAGCSDSGSLPVTERTENIKAATFDPELQKPKDDGCREGLFACEVRRAEARIANKSIEANAERAPGLQKPKDDGCRDGLFACEVRRAEARNANKAAQANAARKPELPED